MRELSLNVLDIAQNSLSAGASLVEIAVSEDTEKDELVISVRDNGRGMTPEQAAPGARSLLHHPYHPQGGDGGALCSVWRRRWPEGN